MEGSREGGREREAEVLKGSKLTTSVLSVTPSALSPLNTLYGVDTSSYGSDASNKSL